MRVGNFNIFFSYRWREPTRLGHLLLLLLLQLSFSRVYTIVFLEYYADFFCTFYTTK